MRLSFYTVCFSLLAGTALAQQAPPPLHIDGTTSGTAQSYWTPQKMMNAKPRPQPPRNSAAVSPSPNTPHVELGTTDGQDGSGQPGAPPTLTGHQLDGLAVRKLSAQSQAFWESMAAGNETEASPAANSKYGLPFTTSEVNDISGEEKGYPFIAAGRLYFTEPGKGDYICSASAISRGIVVAAGHCIAAPASGSNPPHWFTNWMFVPAYDNGKAPLGTWYPSWVDVTGEWWNGDGSVPNPQDVGMLTMADQNGVRLGDVTGYFGWQTKALAGQHVTMLGYPCNLDACAHMIRTDAGNSISGGKNTYQYGSAGGGGYSGGPWLIDFGTNPTNTGVQAWALGTNRVVAVTSYGPSDDAGGFLGASELDDSFTSMLKAMCGTQADACTQ